MDEQNPTSSDWGATGNPGDSMGSAAGSTASQDSGVTGAAGSGVCPTCGQSKRGLDQLLARLGITEEMINNLKGPFENVDLEEYLNTARTYLKDGSERATSFAKENPGKVAAGAVALALGAGLIYAATHRDK